MSNFLKFQGIATRFIRQMTDDGFVLGGFGNDLWLYENGAWGPATKAQLDDCERVLYTIGGEYNVSFAEKTKQIWKSVLMEVQAVSPEQMDRRSLIALPNGTLDAINLTLSEHDPEDMTTRRLAIPFDAEAECPEWLQMLDRIVEDKDEKDAEEYKNFIQEFFGISLVSSQEVSGRDFRKLLVMYGNPATGKSSIADVLRAFFSIGDVCSDDLAFVGSRFGLANLSRAKAWIADDAVERKTQLASGAIKKLITGEPITADRKNKDATSFRYWGPALITTNVRPRVDDESDAVYKRAVLLTFNREFGARDAQRLGKSRRVVPFLREKGEFPGILRWAMIGLHRALERGSISNVRESDEEKAAWREENDPVHAFVKRCCVYDPTVQTQSVAVAAGISELASSSFSDRTYAASRIERTLANEVTRAMPGVKKKQVRFGPMVATAFIGLRVTEDGLAWITAAKEKGTIPGKQNPKVNEKVL